MVVVSVHFLSSHASENNLSIKSKMNQLFSITVMALTFTLRMPAAAEENFVSFSLREEEQHDCGPKSLTVFGSDVLVQPPVKT